MDLERLGENQSLKLITSCESSRSKTLPERCVGPTHLSPKMSKVGNGSSKLKLFACLVKPKKDRLRVNCKAFFTWVGDGVGGLLGGDKAYRKLTLKHHPDKMKRSMKVVLKVFIFWKLAFQFPGSPERPTGVPRFLSRKKAP